jgi:hypothetical protein
LNIEFNLTLFRNIQISEKAHVKYTFNPNWRG